MKTFFFFYYIFLCYSGFSQPTRIEIMAGNEYVLYEHAVHKKWDSSSRWGWSYIANVLKPYNPPEEGAAHEVMNEAHLTFSLNSSFSVLAGCFYTNATSVNGSAAILFVRHSTNWLTLLMPRVDLKDKGAWEMFGFVEYNRPINKWVKLYSRLQALSNYGPSRHNRSYQRFRVGVDVHRLQLGGALNADQYGPRGKTLLTGGLFVRKVFF